jgi:endonuclease YncB( thermonuclease family)
MWRATGTVAAALFGAIIVIDGDTVKTDGKRYRLLGFDTAETRRPKCAEEKAQGKAAAARLGEFIASGAVLERTGKSCKWRRECARLYLDGRDAREVMISEGFAVPYEGRGKRGSWCAPVPHPDFAS